MRSLTDSLTPDRLRPGDPGGNHSAHQRTDNRTHHSANIPHRTTYYCTYYPNHSPNGSHLYRTNGADHRAAHGA